MSVPVPLPEDHSEHESDTSLSDVSDSLYIYGTIPEPILGFYNRRPWGKLEVELERHDLEPFHILEARRNADYRSRGIPLPDHADPSLLPTGKEAEYQIAFAQLPALPKPGIHLSEEDIDDQPADTGTSRDGSHDPS